MSDATPIISIDCPDAAALSADPAWWALYNEAFPPAEREPRDVILGSVSAGVGVALRARRDDRTIGLATLHLLRDPSAVFLVYLAVAPGERYGGLGTSLFERAWEEGASRLRRRGLEPGGMVWEVEPAVAPAHPAYAAREARLAFFRRRGGQLLEHPYVQPPIDGVTPVPMALFYLAADPAAAASPPDPAALVRAMYFEKYGGANGIGDCAIRRLLAGTTLWPRR